MKNPWMSMWLSAANKAAGPARGLWMAEVERQRKAFAKEMTRVWMPGRAAANKPAAPKRRPK